MGQDIAESRFSQADFNEFQARLAAETDLLTDWFEEGRFADTPAEGDRARGLPGRSAPFRTSPIDR